MSNENEMQEKPRLKQEISWVLVLKIMAMIVLWYCCFSSVHRVHVSIPEIVQKIFN